MRNSFFGKLEKRVKDIDSLLCVGLDPHSSELFPNGLDGISEEELCDAAYTFCKTLIDATAPYAACYKPNAAFFEALGSANGASTLNRVIQQIPSGIPVLLDVKRGDIGSTAAAYATAAYDLGADAVTLSPLMGWDSVSPFVTGKYADKGAFLLCKTSNPGSNDLLALELRSAETLYERIAQLSGQWSSRNDNAQLGLVVGATDPVAMEKARQAAGPSVWILAPGVGAQGGSVEQTVAAGLNNDGSGLLIPVSRGISKADDPGAAAKALKEQIWKARIQFLVNRKIEVSSNDIQPYQTEFLKFSLQEGVLKFGSFVLKSGRTSPYFFNAGLFASGASLFKLGKAYASAIMNSSEL
jgi:uridine monophosphate synthetase